MKLIICFGFKVLIFRLFELLSQFLCRAFLVYFVLNFANRCFFALSQASKSNSRLNQHILYYEPIHKLHMVNGQSSTGVSYLNFRFYAFQRDFDLHLTTETNAFSKEATINLYGDNGFSQVAWKDLELYIMNGFVTSDPGSVVLGKYFNGKFEGIIYLNDETFFVEISSAYFAEDVEFPYVVYRQSDVNLTAFFCDEGVCTPRRLHAVLSDNNQFWDDNQKRIVKRADNSDYEEEEEEERWEKLGKNFTESIREEENKVQKVCNLKIVIDHSFFQNATTNMLKDVFRKVADIIEGVNRIYNRSDFREGQIWMQVDEIELYTIKDQINNKFAEDNLTAVQYLERLSEYNFNDYCLGILLTSRTMPDNVGGLAYLARPEPEILGGICTQQNRATNKRTPRNLNTLLYSVMMNNHLLSKAQSAVELSHLIGHSFGSPHDPMYSAKCYPTIGFGGQFLMANKFNYKILFNSDRFSDCSINSINIIIANKGVCLKSPFAVCGNGIVEGSETCDCGFVDHCKEVDGCCTPPNPINVEEGCQLIPGAECTPIQDECCTTSCKIATEEDNINCMKKHDCEEDAICNGRDKTCPHAKFKTDNEPCQNGLGTCMNGHCHDTFCSRNNMERCYCQEFQFQCHLCCSFSSNSCQPAFQYGILKNKTQILLPNGLKCEQGNGECVDGFCEIVGKSKTIKVKTEEKEAITEAEQEPLGQQLLWTFLVIMVGIFGCICLIATWLVCSGLSKYSVFK